MIDQGYVLLSFLWISYCAIHSALISITVTDFFRQVLRGHYRYYRLSFNIFSVVALIPLLRYSDSTRWGTEILFKWEGYMRILQYGLIVSAGILAITAGRHYSLLQFLGIQQILQRKAGTAMTESGKFDCTGVLGVARHPWYLAVFILLWARDLSLTEIIINSILSVYLVIGTFLEERKLVLEFGENYRLYQRRVSMFIPFRWLASKLHG